MSVLLLPMGRSKPYSVGLLGGSSCRGGSIGKIQNEEDENESSKRTCSSSTVMLAGHLHTRMCTHTVSEALPSWRGWCDGLALLCTDRRLDKVTSWLLPLEGGLKSTGGLEVTPGGPKTELLGGQ